MRRAAALPTVLFALCLIGALTVGSAHVSRRAADDARTDHGMLALGSLAEDALAEFVAGWDPNAMAALSTWGVLLAPGPPRPGVRATVRVTRLDGAAYWLVAEAATLRKPLIYKRIAVLLLADSVGVQPAPQAAWFELP